MCCMVYVEIDFHKKYAIICVVDKVGKIVKKSWLNGNTPARFNLYFQSLHGSSKPVLEDL